jgi:hypothetical protein
MKVEFLKGIKTLDLLQGLFVCDLPVAVVAVDFRYLHRRQQPQQISEL